MTDLHIRLLRLIARQRQRELDDYEAEDHTGDTAGSSGHRRDLEQAAGRTKANVTAAEARRVARGLETRVSPGARSG